MVKNADFIGTMDTNPYKFQHYDISDFALFVNGKQYRNEGLSLGMDHEKTSVMSYRTLFEGSGIHHSNAGHQITQDMFVNGYFMLLFDLTPDQGASKAHTSHPEQGNIRVEMKFAKPLPEAITCLLYLEFDNSVLINLARNENGHLVDTVHIAQCRLRLRSYATFNNENLHRHSQCRSPHKGMFTLASRALPTQIFVCLLF